MLYDTTPPVYPDGPSVPAPLEFCLAPAKAECGHCGAVGALCSYLDNQCGCCREPYCLSCLEKATAVIRERK